MASICAILVVAQVMLSVISALGLINDIFGGRTFGGETVAVENHLQDQTASIGQSKLLLEYLVAIRFGLSIAVRTLKWWIIQGWS
jgi:hypothetical protein